MVIMDGSLFVPGFAYEDGIFRINSSCASNPVHIFKKNVGSVSIIQESETEFRCRRRLDISTNTVRCDDVL